MEKEGERMMQRKCGTHTGAVAGVIEALLLVALVAIVISVIQLVYIPQVMEQREAEHMDQVFNQFSSLKSMMDMQTMTRSSSPIFSMITLGSRELPYLITARAYGDLRVNEQVAYYITTYDPNRIKDTLNGVTLVYPPFPSGVLFQSGEVPLTSIEYEASNSYFINQEYILEGGGIIVNQSNGLPVMRANPSISAVYESQSNLIKIHFDLPIPIGMRAKNDTNGDGNCFIRTNYSSNVTYSYQTDKSAFQDDDIKIYTKYLNAWNESLYDILGYYINNSNIAVKIVSGHPGYIEIKPSSGLNAKDILLELDLKNIYVQIGPGWIK
jgi:hypothetical protein